MRRRKVRESEREVDFFLWSSQTTVIFIEWKHSIFKWERLCCLCRLISITIIMTIKSSFSWCTKCDSATLANSLLLTRKINSLNRRSICLQYGSTLILRTNQKGNDCISSSLIYDMQLMTSASFYVSLFLLWRYYLSEKKYQKKYLKRIHLVLWTELFWIHEKRSIFFLAFWM